jgi:diacylglycerol kinase (ATP)
VHEVNLRIKARAGKLAYWIAGLSQFSGRIANFEARVNDRAYRCGFALVSRVRNYGGDLEIARGARLTSDDFEVVLFEGSHPIRYLWYMLAVGIRRVQALPGVHTIRAEKIELGAGVHLQVDGERAGGAPATIEIVRDALTLLMPPDYK